MPVTSHLRHQAAAVLLALLAAGTQAAEPKRFNPNIELPESEGKELVLRSCTQCHELAGLSSYRGYWGRPQWKEMVVGMVKNGAVLLPQEQDIVTDYLTRHFGLGSGR